MSTNTFKFNPKEDSRESVLATVVSLYNKADKSSDEDKLLSRKQKQLRLIDKISNDSAKSYYRQLDEYCISLR